MSVDRRPVVEPEVEAAMRQLANIAADVRFLAKLLAIAPARSSLERLGLREVDYVYRAKLGEAVSKEARP